MNIVPKVYIIILNYRTWEDTIECLESLLKLDYKNFQIVVVDNASKNNSLSFLKGWARGNFCLHLPNDNTLKKYSFPLSHKPLSYKHYFAGKVVENKSEDGSCRIIFLESPINEGYSAGNNLGIEYALSCKDANYFWILNNDTVVSPDSLTHLVKATERKKKSGKKIGAMGSKLIYYHNPTKIQNVGGYYLPVFAYAKKTGEGQIDTDEWNTENVKINYISGASLLVSTQFVHEVGKLSEEYFIYMEEVDWMKRASRKGWDIGYCYEAKVFHKEGMSINEGIINTTSRTKSKMSDYYWIRNKILITVKHFPYYLPVVILSTVLTLFKRVQRGQSERIPLLLRAICHGITGYKIKPEKLR